MKLLFVGSLYPKEIYDSLYSDSKGLLSIPMDVFQWSLIEGLEGNEIDYSIVTEPSLPAWPRYCHFYTPSGKMKVGDMVRGDFLRYCDLPAYKQISMHYVLKKYINNWCRLNRDEDKLFILLFTQQADKLSAVLKLKKLYSNLKVIVIITDLIENAKYYVSNRSLLKRIQISIEKKIEHLLFPRIDKYVLLSRHMEDLIPEACEHNVIVEGIARTNRISPSVKRETNNKILLYTGILEEYAGINDLVDSFRLTKGSDFRFIICGSGPSAEYVKKESEADKRIIFKGKIPHDEVIILQQQATVLINPRKPDGIITKYSFPSKTMEYMMSGTPMIGYHLEGIPEEYFRYMLSPIDLSKQALTDCIANALSKPQEELDLLAANAKQFVLSQKNSLVQTKRILDFIQQD